MTISPSEVAIIIEKRQKAIVGATAEIDKQIKKDAHKDFHSGLLSVGSTLFQVRTGSMRSW
jgi:hypothetical protein